MNQKQHVKTFLQLAVTVCLLTGFDQWTKFLAVRYLKDQADITLIPKVLYFKYLENQGAAFGMFEGKKIFLLLLTGLVMVGVGYVLWKLPEEKKFGWLKWICFFVMAGGIGNMIDRIRLHYVVDFIYFAPINFPVFNVADIYVTVSMIVLFLLVFFYYKEDDFDFLKWKQS